MAKKKSVNDANGDCPRSLEGKPFFGLNLDEEQKAFRDAIWSPDYDIVFCCSKAGTGKTSTATGTAKLLVDYGRYDQIVYIMSPYGDRRQGWLPGTITEKSSVYFEAFYQACTTCGINPHTDFNTESMVNQKNGTGYITCITDTYLRGSTLENAVVILDESQNYTISQLKTILTRIKDSSKVIVIGHDKQCDLANPDSSGFLKCIEHFRTRQRAKICTLTTNYRGWISQWADELEE